MGSQCSARGPTPVLMPVPWSRGNDRSIECMSFDVGGNRSTRRKPTQTRGEHSTQKGRDSNPGPSCCEATALTTAPPCCPFHSSLRIRIMRGAKTNGKFWDQIHVVAEPLDNACCMRMYTRLRLNCARGRIHPLYLDFCFDCFVYYLIAMTIYFGLQINCFKKLLRLFIMI